MSKILPSVEPAVLLQWIAIPDNQFDEAKFKERYGVDATVSMVDAQLYIGVPTTAKLAPDQLIFEPPDPPKTATDYAAEIAAIVAPGIKDPQPLIDALVNLVTIQKR